MSNTILLPFQPGAWCETDRLDPLVGMQRAYVELYIRHLGETGLRASSINTMMHGVGVVGKGNKPAAHAADRPSPARPGGLSRRTHPRALILRPVSGRPIDRRDCYRMVARIAKAAGIPRHISLHSLRHAAITNALDAGRPAA